MSANISITASVKFKRIFFEVKLEDIFTKEYVDVNEPDYVERVEGDVYIEQENDDRYNLHEQYNEIRETIDYHNNLFIKPYEYQQNIINLANEYFITENRGIISLPCGTGKTLIANYIAKNYKISIMITIRKLTRMISTLMMMIIRILQ